MTFMTRWFCAVALALALALPPASARAQAPSLVPGMPPEIQSWREEILSKEKYEELAGRWRAYIKSHPRSAVAHVQLARALRYAGAPEAERAALIQRAYALDPKCPEALAAMASTNLTHKKSLVANAEEALRLAERAATLAPGWADADLEVWPIATGLGRPAVARQHLVAAFDRGAFKPPILDFAYNMLRSAEPGAVVFTNGDNDTYPPLALQAARDLRTDVLVVNLSLLNLPTYASAVWAGAAGGRAPFTPAEIETIRRAWEAGGKGRPCSTDIVEALVRKVQNGTWTGPVYFAITVAPPVLECCGQSLEIEGLLLRLRREPKPADAKDERMDLDKTLRLFRDTFRLESASDLGIRWRPESAAFMIMTNYAAVLSMAAEKSVQAGRMDDARYALRTGITMMDAEGNAKMVRKLATYWKELEPGSSEPGRWLK